MRVPVIAGAVMAVAIILAGGLYLTFFRDSGEVPSPALEAPLEPSSPPETAVTPASSPPAPAAVTVKPVPEQPAPGPSRPEKEVKILSSYEQKIESLKQAISEVGATGQSREVSLVFSEAEANEQAEKLLVDAGIGTDVPLEITGVKIFFKDDDRVLAEIKAAIYGIKPTIKAETRVILQNGEPEIEITRLSFGFLPIPGLGKDKVAQMIMRRVDELKARYLGGQTGGEGSISFEFTDINIRQGEAAINLVIRRG